MVVTTFTDREPSWLIERSIVPSPVDNGIVACCDEVVVVVLLLLLPIGVATATATGGALGSGRSSPPTTISGSSSNVTAMLALYL